MAPGLSIGLASPEHRGRGACFRSGLLLVCIRKQFQVMGKSLEGNVDRARSSMRSTDLWTAAVRESTHETHKRFILRV
jgi:hypothetical protein